MASFYIPMSLSYASNLAHIPPINGLYAFVFNPLIYALLGTCPQMVVGPEAAGSLLTGQVVREAINSGHHPDRAGQKNAQVAGMVTGLAGAIILAAGLCRLGFLDSVLSRPFLRGFISAIGVVIFVDQLIPEMGLDTAAAHSASGAHGSSLDKIMFLFRHSSEANKITCAVAFGAFAVVMVLREVKKRLQPRTPWVAYIPDRFVVVVLSAVLTWNFDWHKQGLDILGNIKAKGAPFQAHFPFDSENFHHVDDAFSTSFLIALLGFFESSVAAKSLGTSTGKTKKVVKADGTVEEEPEGITNVTVSANRELVALGVANMLGGLFMSIPAFGGYGRSKVNASTGGKTPMSSVFLSLITVFCVLFLLPYFYYIPVSPQLFRHLLLHPLTALPESRPLSHDLRRSLLPDRRSAPRHPLLLDHLRLQRTPPHDPHLPHNLLLEPTHRHRRRNRPFPPAPPPPLHPPTHPNPRPRPRHARLRER
jgi:MFS superfamily sulfate permease-like transporter